MGYYGKIEDKLIAQDLRKRGFSYKEILGRVKVSKDSISRWCRDIKLTKGQKERLMNNKKIGQKKGSIIAANNKRLQRITNTRNIYIIAKKQIGRLSKRDRFIAGLSLYAGEGNKTDGQVGFSNSDPNLIKFMMEWFREFCKAIPLEKYRGALWIHEELDDILAEQFWSDITDIPMNQFHKTYIAKNKINSKKIRKNIHKFGVFAIRSSNSKIQRKIMGWIFALFNGKIPKAH